MPIANDVRQANTDTDLTKVIDETDVNYDFVGFAPRGEVAKYATLALAQAEPIWHITRISKNVASVTDIQEASSTYNQIWDDRLTITPYV